jgi:hypothetical protein
VAQRFGFLPFAAVGCRTLSPPAPRSTDGERPTAIRVDHEVERSARVVVDHALILSTMLGNALIPRRDLTIRQLLDGQEEITLIKLLVLAAEARRAVIGPPEIPVAASSEHFSCLTAWPRTALVHQDPALTVDIGAREDQRNQRSDCAKSDQRVPARPYPHIGGTSWTLMRYEGPDMG